MSEYETQLAEWKSRHGLESMRATNQDELLMAAEENQAKGKAWCFGCDKRIPIREMKLITRSIDPYTQSDEGPTDYIAKSNRVRMCPECFAENYPSPEEKTFCDGCKRESEVKSILGGKYCQGCIDHACANMEDAE